MDAEATSQPLSLMHFPDELLVDILRELDTNTIRFVLRLVNKRFNRLSDDVSVNKRVRVPEYWPLEQVPALLSTAPLQKHLVELELRVEDKLQDIYQFMNNNTISFNSLRSITSSAKDLEREPAPGFREYCRVTPCLEIIKVSECSDNEQFDRLYASGSTLSFFMTKFKALNVHWNLVSTEVWSQDRYFFFLNNQVGRFHGTLTIDIDGSSFTIPIDVFMQHGLIEAYRTDTEIYRNSLSQHATSVRLSTQNHLLSTALADFKNAKDVTMEVSESDTGFRELPPTTQQLERLKINADKNQPPVDLQTRYYHQLLLERSPALQELNLDRCVVSRFLLSMLPASLRHLTLKNCRYSEDRSPLTVTPLDLLSLDISGVKEDVLQVILDMLPAQCRITRLHLLDCSNELNKCKLIQHCLSLSILHTYHHFSQGDYQYIFPQSLKRVTLRFDMIRTSDLQTKLEILNGLLSCPQLIDLSLSVNFMYPDNPSHQKEACDWFKDTIELAFKSPTLHTLKLDHRIFLLHRYSEEVITNELKLQTRLYRVIHISCKRPTYILHCFMAPKPFC